MGLISPVGRGCPSSEARNAGGPSGPAGPSRWEGEKSSVSRTGRDHVTTRAVPTAAIVVVWDLWSLSSVSVIESSATITSFYHLVTAFFRAARCEASLPHLAPDEWADTAGPYLVGFAGRGVSVTRLFSARITGQMSKQQMCQPSSERVAVTGDGCHLSEATRTKRVCRHSFRFKNAAPGSCDLLILHFHTLHFDPPCPRSPDDAVHENEHRRPPAGASVTSTYHYMLAFRLHLHSIVSGQIT
jgi:hypothetical protein